METTKVALIGLGTVGSGVAQVLLSHGDRIACQAGRPLELATIIVTDVEKPRSLQLPEGLLSSDLESLINDPAIPVVIQLIGGLEPARTIMLRLLESGKDVITANKALLAEHGSELFERARQLGRSIAFEASVCGGIPIITAIGQSLAANRIESLCGILNGTSNYIMTRMTEEGVGYEEALAEAQQRGYAEADPTLDVDGSDAAQKLAILVQLSYRTEVSWQSIPCTGIEQLSLDDLQCAHQMGYRIKLLGIAQLVDSGLEIHVSPTLVRCGQPLAEVRNSENAISVVGDIAGHVFFQGPGAGQMPTASAVVADLIDTVVGRSQLTFQQAGLGMRPENPLEMNSPGEHSGRYYLRMSVVDEPGVMAEVAGILGSQQVSINSIIQRESTPDGTSPYVPLIIMTHTTTEGALDMALAELEQSENVLPGCVRMRVLD
jgi:homoserine dehydrogenase